MDYLTNYYKNLCEQLQQKLLVLQETVRSAKEIAELGQKEHEEAILKKRLELGRSLTPEESEELIQTHFTPYAKRAAKREGLTTAAAAELRDVAMTGDVDTARSYANVTKAMLTRDIGGSKQAGFADRSPSFQQSSLENRERMRALADASIARGNKETAPPSIADLRKFVAMGTGRYQAPFPQPGDFTPDAYDGPDPGTHGDAKEVETAQRSNQYRGNLR